MRNKLAAASLALLAACASPNPVGISVREIPTPTPVACVTREQLPAEPERVGNRLTGNAVVDLALVAASALELRKWGGEQRALLEGCVE
jgi:uncharacterized lipoprotein YmbA